MFNDRDLAVLGFGAAAAVCCLLLPVPFSWKVAAGLSVLVVSMVAAFLRLDRDRLTLEEWLIRRIRFAVRPRRWTFRQKQLPTPQFKSHKRESPDEAGPPQEPKIPDPPGAPGPLRFVFVITPSVAERLAGLLLLVVALYFVSWLWLEGAGRLGGDLGLLLP